MAPAERGSRLLVSELSNMAHCHVCEICHGNRVSLIYVMSRFDIYRCLTCSHLFSDIKVRHEAYRQDYYLKSHKEYFERPDQKLYRRLHHFIRKHQPEIRHPKLLDIGTGIGSLPRYFEAQGYESWGIDTSEDSINYGGKVLKIARLEAVSVDDFKPACLFNVATAVYVIEHVRQPIQFLQATARLLEQNGLLICLTVNSASFFFSIAEMLYRVSGGRFLSPLERLCEVHHLHHFNERSLNWALDQSGFVIVERFSMNLPLSSLTVSPLQRLILGVLYSLSPVFNSYFLQGVVCIKKGVKSGSHG